MKISDSEINQYSQHIKREQHIQRERLEVWNTSSQQNALNNSESLNNAKDNSSTEFSATHVELSSISSKRKVSFIENQEVTEEQKVMADLNMRILQALVERITGKKINITDLSRRIESKTDENKIFENESHGEVLHNIGQTGFGMKYEYYESHYEHETVNYSASGIVQTEDGKKISIGISLNMSRDFFSEESVEIKAGEQLKDPLVINFDSEATHLTQRDFFFDIDADGMKDQIAFVHEGSGFLALDKNGDGSINDGSELFGTLSGNGFMDLQQYDGDNNGWIDENDSIFEKLRIWTRVDGSMQLLSLGEKGVGAIYLGHMTTPFSIKDESNNLEGKIVSTGFFLKENGGAGTIQQVDLVA